MNNQYLTSKQMYAIDQMTINEIGIPSPVLMERAAHAVFLALEKELTKEDNILIIAGSGNNGGDAVALARMFHLSNYSVKLHVIDNDNYSEGMALQMKIARNIHIPMLDKLNVSDFKDAQYIIEGIFGIGLSREIEGRYRSIIAAINQQKDATVIALDIPSGLSAKTAKAFKTVIQANSTYTFGFLKKGMDTKKGKQLCGKITVCDLGYPKSNFKLFNSFCLE